jgi:hypothetical protein
MATTTEALSSTATAKVLGAGRNLRTMRGSSPRARSVGGSPGPGSTMTDGQWVLLAPLLPAAVSTRRARTKNMVKVSWAWGRGRV